MKRLLIIIFVLTALPAYGLEVDLDSNGDVDVAFGGTNASTAGDARTNLGLVIGTNVQAYDADLDTYATITPAANVQSIMSAADYAAIRALLDLEAGTDFLDLTGVSTALDAFTGSANIVTLGTIATGVWQGTALTAGYLNINGATAETTIAADDKILIYDTSAGANRSMTRGNFVTGIGAGQAIVLDLADDGTDESSDLGEIAVTGDTNSIFTEPSADKLAIDVSANWPTADAATTAATAAAGDSATAFFSAGTIEHEYGGLEADVSAYTGLLGVTGGATTEVDTAAELETFAGLGAFANEYLDDADAATMRTTLGLAIGTNVLAPDGSGTSLTGIAVLANAADVSGVWEVQDDTLLNFGDDADFGIRYDETTDNQLEIVSNSASDTEINIANAGGDTNLTIDGDITYSGSLISGGSGDSYIGLSNNASLAGSGYQLFFEAGDFTVVENGTEKLVLNDKDGATLTGTSWDFGGVTNFEIPNGNSVATDAEGEIAIDTDDEQLKLYVGGAAYNIDFSNEGTSGYVLKTDGSGNIGFEADATGGTPALTDVTDPVGDTAIEMAAGEEINWQYTGNYTTGSQFLVQQLTGNPTGGVLFEARGADADSVVARFGDGTNIWNISTAGLLSNAGTATINIAAANDLNIGGAQISYDDLASGGAISTTGTAALGVTTVTGVINTSVGLDAVGAVDLDIGSDDVLDITFISDGDFIFTPPADTDITVTFTGTTASGEFKWMEDEDYFQFSDAVVFDLAATFTTAPNLAADSVDTLTEIAAALKSGADATLITGTEGDANDIVVWDANGDAVSSGEALSEVVTAARVGGASDNLDDTDASIEWEDAGHLDASGNVTDFALGADADAGDYDVQSVDKLEGVDADVYVDLGADGVVEIQSDTTVQIGASDENLQITDGGENEIAVGTGTGVTSIDFGNLSLQASINFNSYSAAQTLTQDANGGGIVQMTVADEVTMWDCETANVGNFVSLWALEAEQIEVVPASGDHFVLLDGTAMTADYELDMDDTAGAKMTLLCTADDTWSVYYETGTSSDGGAAD